jgi:hypothetical protein
MGDAKGSVKQSPPPEMEAPTSRLAGWYSHRRHPGRLRRASDYRKTDRRNPRASPLQERKEYRLIFQLPQEFAWSTAAGPHGTAVTVDGSNVTTKSFDKEYTLKKAAEFVQALAKDSYHQHITGVMQIGHTGRETVHLIVTKGTVVVFTGRSGWHRVYHAK